MSGKLIGHEPLEMSPKAELLIILISSQNSEGLCSVADLAFPKAFTSTLTRLWNAFLFLSWSGMCLRT